MERIEPTRRQAIACGAAAAVAAASTALPGTASNARAEGAAATPRWSWETAPQPITDFSEEVTADVIVVGAGYAGLSAACSAAENGLEVVVVEKGSTVSGRTAQTGTFNPRQLAEAGITYTSKDRADIARKWIQTCGCRAVPDLVFNFLDRSGEASDWLSDKVEQLGGTVTLLRNRYTGDPFTEYYGNIRPALPESAPDPAKQADLDEFNAMGQKSPNMYFLWQVAKDNGTRFEYEARAEQLIRDDAGVHSVAASKADGTFVKYTGRLGVVMATGDIGGDDEMCARFAPDMLRCPNQYTPAGMNTGDGQKMGYWAGAKMQETPYAQMLHPVAYGRISHYYLHVNPLGQRFFNEDTWCQNKSYAILGANGGQNYAYAILHGKWQEETARAYPIGGGLFWGPSSAEFGTEYTPDYDAQGIGQQLERGTAYQADSLEELADLIAADDELFDPQTFLATVERYNEMCDRGEDIDYGKRPELLFRIDTPPFTACKTGPGRMVAIGGMMVDTKSRVLGTDDKPIEGLYAIGNVSGGLYAVDYPTYLNATSMGRCLTAGYLVGRELAGLE